MMHRQRTAAACVALLRGVNIAGNKQVAMSDLRDLLAQLGFEDARTMLQSGNLVFRASRPPGQIEALLEGEIEERLQLRTQVFVRTAGDLKKVIARNPFTTEAARDPGRLVVMFLKDAPTARTVEALQAAIIGREVVRADGRHAYIVYPDGQGRSRLTHALVEKKLETSATGRNWNTVVKLGAAVDQ